MLTKQEVKNELIKRIDAYKLKHSEMADAFDIALCLVNKLEPTISEIGKYEEQISACIHDIWRHWMKYLFSKCKQINIDDSLHVVIPKNYCKLWEYKMNCDYSALKLYERESDKDQAEKIIEAIHKAIKEAK